MGWGGVGEDSELKEGEEMTGRDWMAGYYERISQEERQASRREEGTELKEACPLCRGKVKMWSWGEYGQSGVVRCGTPGCMCMEIRGL